MSWIRKIYSEARSIWRVSKGLGISIAQSRRLVRKQGDLEVLNTRFGTFHIRPKDSDLPVLLQVFADKEYDLGDFGYREIVGAKYQDILDRGNVPVVVDAGANIGAATVWFATLYPKAAVVGIEPVPSNCDLARKNTAAFPNARILEAAVGATPGKVRVIEIVEAGAWAAKTERADTGLEVVTVPQIVADIPNGELFIAKIDIEGFESDLFRENTAWVADAAALFIEPHDWMMPGEGSSLTFQKALLGQGREILIVGENLVFV